MRANPGGEIDPADVLGRDSLIAGMWRVLRRQSLELTAERRIGKSSIIKKMTAEPAAGFLAIYQDLEGVRSRIEFVEVVYRQVEAMLSRRKQRADRFQKLIASLGGVKFRGLSFPRTMAPDWKPLLLAVASDLQEHLDLSLVFFWDELPFMLQNIQAGEGLPAARELLDVLRSIRQTSPSLRMVYTGSIGLHHVLAELREGSGISHAPMNDMDRLDVPPLSLADATDLALRILDGEGLACSDRQATAETLARDVDGIAYYVHLVIDGLVKAGDTASPATIRSQVKQRIHDPVDPWNLEHFQRRLESYYGSRQPLAAALLDVIAGREGGVSRSTLQNVASTRFDIQDPEAVPGMIGRLVRDHYIQSDVDGGCRFSYSVVRRWWQFHRLGSRSALEN